MKKLLFPILALFLLAGFKPVKKQIVSGIVIRNDNQLPVPGATVSTRSNTAYTTTGADGKFKLAIEDNEKDLIVRFLGYKAATVKVQGNAFLTVRLIPEDRLQDAVTIAAAHESIKREKSLQAGAAVQKQTAMALSGRMPGPATETYSKAAENGFRNALKDPLSTFSIDVDAASYTNVRRFINNGSMPPADAVRIEEMINYFDYQYPQPKGNDPVNIVTEVSAAPWNKAHKLVHIGLQGKTIPTDALPASNLVFLIDVSGSMSGANKLPLLVASFKLLTDQLRAKDHVAIVVYAGSSGVVLPSTGGDEKTKIKDALEKLHAGGSTAGGQGIELAYKIAAQNYIAGGNNRVILATDGDFNVGLSSDASMEKLITEKRRSGIFLTVLGYGMGNYKDSKMEILADKGNGNYAYIDNISEARKVLVKEFGGTLFTVAKDVKLQVEFNPAKVAAYRLVGYENRMLASEDFNNDQKDAGELGSGHTVTALYEIIPVGVKSSFTNSVDPLKYQKNPAPALVNNNSKELLTVKLRYKTPEGNTSKLLSAAVADAFLPLARTSDNFRFSSAVAEFGMLLSQSEFRQEASFDALIERAATALGKDKEGYRHEFLGLAKSAKLMAVDLLSLKDKKLMNGKEDKDRK